MCVARRRAALATLLLAVLASTCSAEAGYSTVYACEGSTLKLECGDDELINLIRANFGRFSITICNEKGNTDWSVNCMSPRSLRVLEQSVMAGVAAVGNKCSVDVTAEKFGDSCPGTFKYIEVHYSCVSAASTTTTKRPHPPWYSSYPDPNLWLTSGTTTSRRPPATTTTRRPRLPGLPPAASNDGVQVIIPGVTGRRQQGGRVEKVDECKSILMAALEERLLSGEHTLRVAAELAQVTDRSDGLFGGDVRTAARLVNHLASRQAQQLIAVPAVERREAIVTELTEDVVRAASNVLDAGQLAAWRDLGPEERRRAATSLLIGLEQNAFLLSDNVLPDRTILEIDRNLLMTVHNKKVESMTDLHFPSDVALDQWDIAGNSMHLSKASLLENSRRGTVKVVFLAYSGLESVLEPLSWSERRHEAALYPAANRTRIVNSLVLSASLGEGRHIQLSQPVHMTFRHLTTENVTNPSCSFWDYTVNMWSEEGCRVTFTNRTHTMCECDHLTSFAVLMDVFAAPLTQDDQALRIVVYVGCAVALLCLCATLLALILLRGLQSDRTSIHKNLIVCLLMVELSFLVGLHQTGSPVVCGVLAGLMHFFLMAAFFWLFFEAFQLYVTLTVFEGERSRLKWYYVAAYGIPLLIVAVSCVVDPISYGTESHCWLRTDNYFVFSFAGPAIILILLTAIFLGLAVFVMLQHSSAAITIKTKEQSRLSYIRAWLRAALLLLLLLVLTWTFGLVFLDQRTVVMAYLFTVANALLGLFIFALHCVQNEKVRKELDSHGLLPVCLKSSKTLGRDHAEALSTSNGTINTVLNLATQNNIPRLWSPHAPTNPKSATLNSLNPAHTPAGSLRRGTMRSSMPAKLRTSLGGEVLAAEKSGAYNMQSHDSGHGTGSENESPHLTLNNVRYLASAPSLERPAAVLVPVQPGELGPRVNPEFFAVYQQQVRRGGRGGRSHSPYHTYMEVDGDPVYEEIERHEPRHELLVSDVSDEDRKQSDMSRQSSRNYSDNRPLIPYGAERAVRAGGGQARALAASQAGLRDFDQAQMYHDLRRLRGYGENVAMAVLSGDQVVCTLQPPHLAAIREGATLPVDRARPSHSRLAEC
ncbi:LOW QUALITY PROTEIN: latrophilin Cirl-like [Pollicipes pollicipes]|uniref:LOW QUALITY PROTEIN: latrophilin Cirl-like n=1 Tax=Pollicipes pollicipes TaxID=41117 RepID=UPI0018859656|nr:LOW QUALITY PROTEIN: latrophilin Cirl-like [Pollicipes pollicipes]